MMMKRFLIALFLFLGFTYAESPIKRDFEVGKWRGFFGVEGGVGVFGMGKAFVGSYNPLFSIASYAFGLGYSVGILGGWQKYTSEKIGMRNTLGFKFSYVPNISSIQNNPYKDFCFLNCKDVRTKRYDGRNAQNYDAFYMLDGLFDFVKNGNNRFGMSVGMDLTFSISDGERGYYVDNLEKTQGIFGIVARFGLRIGIYTQIDNSILDAVISLPLAGFGGVNPIYGNTLTLGYKYLF